MADATTRVSAHLQAALFVGVLTKITQAMRGQATLYDLEETEWLLFQHWGTNTSSAHAATVLALELVRHAMELAAVDDMHERFSETEERARNLAAGLSLALEGYAATSPPATVTPLPVRKYGS